MATKKSPARLIERGATIVSRRSGLEEVVRSVTVVLHLANGEDEVYASAEKVTTVIVLPELNPQEMQLAEAMGD
jgi:hypothetical protein